MLLVLLTACGSSRVIRLDTGVGAPREYRPSSSAKAVRLGAADFEEALRQLVLEVPLALRAPEHGWLVRTSSSTRETDKQVQRLLRKSFGGLCQPGQLPMDCLSLLDDVWGLSPTDKLAVALGLSFGHMRESIAEAVKDTLAPQFFYAVALTGVVTWVVLAANPEPVFTKALAIASAVMIVYLGVEGFLELVKASVALKEATDRANTYEELEAAGERFGKRVGPEAARVAILAMTVVVSRGMVGGAAGLASRLSMLPHFPQAAAVGASQLNLRLASAAQVSAVAVVEGNLVISLPPTAVAMAAKGSGSAPELNWGNWKSQPTFGHTFSRHGQGEKNTNNLRGRAAGTGTPQGQWADNEAAARHLKEVRPSIDGTAVIPIPEGLGWVIMPNGSIVPTRHALVVPKVNGGIETAYPVLGPM